MTSDGDAPGSKSQILVVEDDPSTLGYLCEVIATLENAEVTASVGSVHSAIKSLQTFRPDLVLSDLGLPDGDGADVIRLAAGMDIPAMVISVFDDEATVLRAVEAGASGYLLKDQSRGVLRQAIADLLAGGSPVTPSIANFLLKRLNERGMLSDSGDENSVLSKREKEVLILLAQGYKTKEVAGMLVLSHHTVASHQRNVYSKLSVKNKSEAVAVAMKKGLINP